MPETMLTATPASAASGIVSVRGLGFQAGTLPIIDDLSFDLGATGCTVLMGYNGAGKSVLLRLLHGILEPSRGSIVWHGNGTAVGAQAMVFQQPTLLRRSVADNIRYVMTVRGVPRAMREPHIRALLADAEIAHLADRSARVLSGGERQRVAVVQALCGTPRVLFLDEPTASLDPAATLIVERLIRHAQQQGTRVILVTQDIGQGRRLADDVIFLHHGRLREHTPARRFFEQPDSDVARAFLDGRLYL